MFLEHLCVRRGLGWNLNKPKTLLFRLWRNRGVLQFVATNALFAISIKNSGYTWLYRLPGYTDFSKNVRNTMI